MRSTSERTTITTTRTAFRRGAGVVMMAGALLLAGCGSDAEPAAVDSTGATSDPAATGATGSDGGAETTAAADDGAAAVDVCSAITADDIQGAVPAADPITAVPNEVIPVPTCDYRISIGEGSTTIDAAIVSIQRPSTDPAYYASQRDLQEDQFDDVAPVEGLSEGFSYGDSGTIVLTTESGVWMVVRGVEVDKEATTQLTADEMAAVAQLVEERL